MRQHGTAVAILAVGLMFSCTKRSQENAAQRKPARIAQAQLAEPPTPEPPACSEPIRLSARSTCTAYCLADDVLALTTPECRSEVVRIGLTAVDGADGFVALAGVGCRGEGVERVSRANARALLRGESICSDGVIVAAEPPASADQPPEQATSELPDAAKRHRVLSEMIDGIQDRHKRLMAKCKRALSARRANGTDVEFDWNQWSRDYNEDFHSWRNAQTSTLESWGLGPGAAETDEERTASDIGVAIGDLLQLWSECNGRIKGREGDITFFDNAVKSGVSAARVGLRKLAKRRPQALR